MSDATARTGRARRRYLGLAIGAFLLAGAGAAAHWALVSRHYESTDDAYVNGNVVQITPQVSGTVVEIGADDTQFVHAGQTLVRLDPADAKVALDQAQAQLARTVREVRNLFATSAELRAQMQVRATALSGAQQDLARRERLGRDGVISGEELQHSRDALRSAQAGLIAAQQELAANQARVDHTSLENHPDVRTAAAAVRSAYLAYTRTLLPSPVSGLVARRNVQLGERVSPGTALMAVVPLDQVWVDANFKEPQLEPMRLGQPVTLVSDVYGRSAVYHGRVIGFGAGTGAAFALLPAQNATGNWIKIVQRVPVRVALDSRELAAHPLQIGLSMKVEVDVRDRSGARLAQGAPATPAYATDVFASEGARADETVRSIIAANSAAPLAAVRSATVRPAALHAASRAGNGFGAMTAQGTVERGF